MARTTAQRTHTRRCRPQQAAILERLDAVLDDSAVAGAGAADSGAEGADGGQFEDA